MKADTFEKIGIRYELTVILIVITAVPLFAYALLNLHSSAIPGIGALLFVSSVNLASDIIALFSIQGIHRLSIPKKKSWKDRNIRCGMIRPANWIAMTVFSALTLAAVILILKDSEFMTAFLGLSVISLVLCIYADTLGIRAMKMATPRGRPVRQ